MAHKNKNITQVDEETFLYYGYTIKKDGTIISPCQNTLRAYNFTYPGSHITFKIKGKCVKKNKAILIYELFSGKRLDTNKNVIRFKDGDTHHANYDNLFVNTKKEYYQMLAESRRLGISRLSDEEKEKIRNEYLNPDGEKISMRALSRKHDCCLATIQKILA